MIPKQYTSFWKLLTLGHLETRQKNTISLATRFAGKNLSGSKSNLQQIGLVLLTNLICWFFLTACGSGNNTAITTPANNTAITAPTTTSVASNSGDSNLIRIYSSLPLAGESKAAVETIINAFKLAIDDATGGTGKLGNFRIEYISLNDALEATGQWDAELEKTNAMRAAADPHTLLYLGPSNSGAAKISLPILNQAGIAMISPGNTYPGLTRNVAGITRANEPDVYYPTKVRNYFRVITPDDVQGPAVIELFNQLKAKKIFVIDDSQVYGKGLADAVVTACKKAALDCSHRTSITGQETDYNALVTGIKTTNPDIIFFGGIPEQRTVKLLSDIRAGGIKVPFVGGDGINVDTFAQNISQAGISENVYATNPGSPETSLPAKGLEVLKRYRAKFGQVQYPTTLLGYETMHVALAGINRAGVKDRKAVIQALGSLQEFDGVFGKWSFDKNGDTTLTDFTVLQVIGGRWQVYNVIRPQAGNSSGLSS